MLRQTAELPAQVDLVLSMIEKDIGPDVVCMVSKSLAIHHRRAGDQSQHSALLELDAKSDRIQSAPEYAKRFAKRQQMQWTKRGAHLLLQTRIQVLDGTLRPLFEKWYPGLASDNSVEEAQAAWYSRHPEGLRHGGATQTLIAGSVAARPPVLKAVF
jgi:hypothetical protein